MPTSMANGKFLKHALNFGDEKGNLVAILPGFNSRLFCTSPLRSSSSRRNLCFSVSLRPSDSSDFVIPNAAKSPVALSDCKLAQI